MSILTEKLKELQLSGGRILDVGTGRGDFISTFTELFKDYTEIIGIDSSEKSIEIAQQNFKKENIKFIKMDAEKIAFEDNSMDTVCISNTLHHLPDFNKVLKEMFRVLKPGGLFIINEMFCDNQSEKQLSHVYLHHLSAEIDSVCGKYHANTFKKQEIIEIAKKTGIKIEASFEYETYEEQAAQTNDKDEREVLDRCFESLDKYVEQINTAPEYSQIRNRIAYLKEALYKVGFMGATELIIIGRK
jgi:ubiquinone/menaquinone biosynthesis C-methylase UbiE